jgi:hypothetical protein
MQVYTSFSESDIKAFEPTVKVGMLATINARGLPHLSLISSLQASTPTQVIWGQFTEGLSKKHVRENPKTAFLTMTLDRELWRGKANLTHTAQQGPEYEMYNNVPMFRYNPYFGIHTVYYMDLVSHTGRQALPMSRIVVAALQTMVARTLSRERSRKQALNLWTRQLMNKLDNLKYLAYVGADGYPLIVPLIQAQAADGEHVIFSLTAYKDELGAIPQGTSVAIFGMSLSMEDVLMRGDFLGVGRVGGVRCGRVRVNWVYNSMPPKPGQIYPQVDVEPVTAF